MPELSAGFDASINELLQQLSALTQSFDAQNSHISHVFDIVVGDISRLRREQSELEEKLDCVIYVMQADLEELRSRSGASTRSIDMLVDSVNELKKPVSDIIALRSRGAGVLLGIGIVGSAILWLVEPFYQWYVEQNYAKH